MKLLRMLKKILIALLLIAAIVCCIIIVTPLIISFAYGSRFGMDSVWLLTGNTTGIPLILSLVFWMIVVWLFVPDKWVHPDAFDWLPDIKSEMSPRKKGMVTVCSLFVVIMGSLFASSYYDRFTMDGVEISTAGSTTAYTWEDVDYYTLKADSNGVPIYQLVMKDGTKVGFLGGSFRSVEYPSTGFEEAFSDGSGEYAVELTKKLHDLGKELKVSDWDELTDSLDYDYWKEVVEDIRTAAE